MTSFYKRLTRFFVLSLILILLISPLSACSILPAFNTTNSNNEFPLAEVLFRAKPVEEIPADAKIMLEILDDVTGLYFNSSRFEMTRGDNSTFNIRIPLKVATEVKYRYVLESTTSEYEHDAEHQQVRFRILRINGPNIVEDIIAGWSTNEYEGPVGQITGQIIDRANNAPIPNLLITAGGYQAISSSDGSFLLNDLVPGVHNLVIYSMDGAYVTFQQGALVADGANTPVKVLLEKRPTTRVTFEVVVPPGFGDGMPLRFVSNILTLGNSYADLSSGSPGAAINYPVMTRVSNNRYRLELELPVGTHLRYKYSYGDGFWNAELSEAGNFVTRDLVVTDNSIVKNRVNRFSSPDKAAVKVIVKVPGTTPQQEVVFLQLKPFGWMEPIPMVSRGSGIWEYTLYSPLHFINEVAYRFCRNGECDVAANIQPVEESFTPLATPQDLTSVVVAWQGLSDENIDSSKLLVHESLTPRTNLITGVEMIPGYTAGWRATIDDGLNFAGTVGGDFVILTPTWTARLTRKPELNNEPGRDLLWTELMTQINHVTMSGQKTILFPQINYAQDAEKFWASDAWSAEWQNAWVEQYKRFLFNNADMAQIMGVDGLIIEEPSLAYLPYAQNSIDTSETSRLISTDQWDAIISELRNRYYGKLIGAATYSADNTYIPSWLNQVDMVYALLSPALEIREGSVEEITRQFNQVLDEQVYPQLMEFNKPVLIGLSYPSSIQAALGLQITRPYQVVLPEDAENEKTTLELQAKIFNAAVLSTMTRDWINGFIARGFFPYAELQDGSSSVYRKPTSEILWFWFHYLLNKTP